MLASHTQVHSDVVDVRERIIVSVRKGREFLGKAYVDISNLKHGDQSCNWYKCESKTPKSPRFSAGSLASVSIQLSLDFDILHVPESNRLENIRRLLKNDSKYLVYPQVIESESKGTPSAMESLLRRQEETWVCDCLLIVPSHKLESAELIPMRNQACLDLPDALVKTLVQFCSAGIHPKGQENKDSLFSFSICDDNGTKMYCTCALIWSSVQDSFVINCLLSFVCNFNHIEDSVKTWAKTQKEFDQEEFVRFCREEFFHKKHSISAPQLIREDMIFQQSFDAQLLLKTIDLSCMMQVFYHILLESRIIFHSSQVSLLSLTIESLLYLLHPFQWPHPCIPVLPSHLFPIANAPVPFIAGIPTWQLSVFQESISKDVEIPSFPNFLSFLSQV